MLRNEGSKSMLGSHAATANPGPIRLERRALMKQLEARINERSVRGTRNLHTTRINQIFHFNAPYEQPRESKSGSNFRYACPHFLSFISSSSFFFIVANDTR